MAEEVLLLDANALVALALTTHQHHRAAHAFLADVGRWATCPTTESALLRLLLNPAISGRPVESGEVRAVLTGMRADPRWTFLADDTSLAAAHVDVVVLGGHQQVTDLHLVNLAARHGARLATFDAAIPTWLAPADRGLVRVIPG